MDAGGLRRPVVRLGAAVDSSGRKQPGSGGGWLRRAALLVALLAAGALLAVAVAPVQAQEDQPTDDEVNRVAKGIYCPVCENVPLDVCPTVACQQWRQTIREQLAAGWTQAEIEDYFVAQYGDRVLATPPASGLNWAVYLLPPAAFIIGVAILTNALRSWRRPDEHTGQAPELPDDDPYLQRLEDELRRRSEA